MGPRHPSPAKKKYGKAKTLKTLLCPGSRKKKVASHFEEKMKVGNFKYQENIIDALKTENVCEHMFYTSEHS